MFYINGNYVIVYLSCINEAPIVYGIEVGEQNKKEGIKVRRNMKKLGCAILCICLLLINTPYSMSYAENMEQNASETDAQTDTTTEDVDVPETEESAQATIGTATAEAEIDAEPATATDALLYAASEDESGGGV